jgi:hypothetical protein
LRFFVILLNSSLGDQYLAMSNPGNCDVSSFEHLLELEQDAWSFSQWRSPSVDVLQQLNSSSSPPNCAVGSAHGKDDEVDVEVEDIDDECSRPLDEVDDNADADGTVKLLDNDYVNGILKSADLHILQPGQVSSAYNSSWKESDLFHLFFTKNFLETICKWSNEALISKGHKSCSSKEFFAYIGLELGMSLVKYNDIKSYWASGCFVEHDTFRDCMSRTRFQNIRSAVRFSAQSSYDANMAHNDPLWFICSVLDQFIKKSASIAVPVGVSALDENSCPTKARTKAKTYSPNKPAKYAIRFYAVVGHKFCYLSSMFDNRAGNSTGIEGVHDYCHLFRTL